MGVEDGLNKELAETCDTTTETEPSELAKEWALAPLIPHDHQDKFESLTLQEKDLAVRWLMAQRRAADGLV